MNLDRVPPHVVDAVGRPLSDAELAVYQLGVTDGLRAAARLCREQVEQRDRTVFDRIGGEDRE